MLTVVLVLIDESTGTGETRCVRTDRERLTPLDAGDFLELRLREQFGAERAELGDSEPLREALEARARELAGDRVAFLRDDLARVAQECAGLAREIDGSEQRELASAGRAYIDPGS